MATPIRLKDDLLTGADAIADYVGWSRRQIYYAAAQKHLPITTVGATLVARKSELNQALSGAAAVSKSA